jgi:hypothetical protein
VAVDAEAIVAIPEAEQPVAIEAPAIEAPAIEAPDATETPVAIEEAPVADEPPDHPSVADQWRGESFERAERQRAAGELADLEERFDTLRIELEAALDRRIRVAVDQLQITFDQEIEALRTVNREEAKRVRSANDEAFVRIRVANTAELERIKAAIDEGVARLCSVLEGQLDRVWAANDVELERIRSAGADRLAEVHDVLTHQLDQLREERSKDEPAAARDLIWSVEPAPTPEATADEPELTSRRWLRRRGVPAPH